MSIRRHEGQVLSGPSPQLRDTEGHSVQHTATRVGPGRARPVATAPNMPILPQPNQTARSVFLTLALGTLAFAQSPALVPVVSKPISRTVELPGELQPYLSVAVHAPIPGYVERVLVDRGSTVKQGDLLVELSAPEL